MKYTKHRMVRLSDTSYRIAAGLACGAAISFTPLVGTHFIQAGVLAFVLRANLLASFVGTFIGNPWTFPIIWWCSFRVGSYLFSWFGWQGPADVPDAFTLDEIWDLLWAQPLDVFLPWMLGGYIIAFFAWFPSYFIYYFLIEGARAARQKVRVRKIHRVAKEVTGQKR